MATKKTVEETEGEVAKAPVSEDAFESHNDFDPA